MPKKDNRLITYEKLTILIYYSKVLLSKYPKSERFDLCTDIKQILYRTLRNVTFAWKEYTNEDKLKYLKEVDVDLVMLKSLIRVSYEFKYITPRNYMTWNEHINEIGKLVGGWIKVCQKE